MDIWQSILKDVTQSYRACKMAASCIFTKRTLLELGNVFSFILYARLFSGIERGRSPSVSGTAG